MLLLLLEKDFARQRCESLAALALLIQLLALGTSFVVRASHALALFSSCKASKQ